MDPKKKSALTAALSGALSRDGLGQGDRGPQPKDDTFAFPCLAKDGEGALSEATAGFENLDLKRTTLAGSAPTASRLSGAVSPLQHHVTRLKYQTNIVFTA